MDKYTGQTISVDLVPFIIFPEQCVISYSCADVVREDGEASNVSCSDITLTADGKVTYSFDSNDYINNNIKPGVYIIQIKGTATQSG